jgi:hypothetical protein
MTIHGKLVNYVAQVLVSVVRIVNKNRLSSFLSIVFLGIFVLSCTSNKKVEERTDENQTEVILVEGNLDAYKKDWQIGQKQIDTLMFLDAAVGARAQMSFIDNNGKLYQFGDDISDVKFIDEQTLEGVQKLKNKTFILHHRKLTMKGSDSEEFSGDREVDVITAVGNSHQPLQFQGLKSKYRSKKGRFVQYEMGDLSHYIFKLENGEEYDFNGMKDDFYDFEYDQEKYKNKPFLIFYKDENFVDPDNGPYTASIIYTLIPLD